jgi:hypothetical protein
MNKETAHTIATVLGGLGVIFMLIMAFGVFFENRMVPLFLGVACFVISGVVRTLGPR